MRHVLLRSSTSGLPPSLSWVAFCADISVMGWQVLHSRQRTWLHALVSHPAPPSSDETVTDSSSRPAPHSQHEAAASASAAELGSRFTLFWRRTDANSQGEQCLIILSNTGSCASVITKQCWVLRLWLARADGEGLGVLPITESMLRRGIGLVAQSILQPRHVVAVLTARTKAAGVVSTSNQTVLKLCRRRGGFCCIDRRHQPGRPMRCRVRQLLASRHDPHMQHRRHGEAAASDPGGHSARREARPDQLARRQPGATPASPGTALQICTHMALAATTTPSLRSVTC